MPLLGCLPSSPAAYAGLPYGDVVLRVNGTCVRDIGEYVLHRLRHPDRLVVTVFRDGTERELSITLGAGAGHDAAALGAELAAMRLFGDGLAEGAAPPS